jgi:hypothetical protein
MANEIGWGAAVSNLIGWGKPSEDGDNLINENATDLLESEADEFLLSEASSVNIAGWGEMYDYSYWGDTIPER